MIVIIINIYDHGHLIGEEHKEMVLVAALEDRLGCVWVELNHLKVRKKYIFNLFEKLKRGSWEADQGQAVRSDESSNGLGSDVSLQLTPNIK